MDMSFKEKSTWISLVITLGIFGYYFINIWQLASLPPEVAKERALDLLSYVIVVTIILEAVFHGMLAATNHKAADLGADERDKLLEYKSNNLGYTVLAVGVIIVLGRLIFVEHFPQLTVAGSSLGIPMLTAHLLLFAFILSEIVRFSALVIHYRRGM